ncbi:hypothetical protein VE04_10265 [Pseudogymnoascus sp. 24MN13]|nr:hypothetical protein VE04_10265 [Pseudogymnoascus sp. 24MN13]
MALIKLSAIVLLAFSGLVFAALTSQVDEFPDIVVLIRNSMEEGFAHSPAMSHQIKSEIRSGLRSIKSTEVVTGEPSIVPKSSACIDGSWEVLDVLENRLGSISLSYYQNSTCNSGCLQTTSTFKANFCLNVPGTQCINIWSMSNAKIRYWNHTGCNGNESTDEGCGVHQDVSATGTNSISFQLNYD